MTGGDLDYFANELASPRNLREHVDEILIPRVSGTQGNKRVREVRWRVGAIYELPNLGAKSWPKCKLGTTILLGLHLEKWFFPLKE